MTDSNKTVRPWTAGEWVVLKNPEYPMARYMISSNPNLTWMQGTLLGLCGVSGEANAQLIAAAPALYEALEALLDEQKSLPDAVEAAIAALRKANPAALEVAE